MKIINLYLMLIVLVGSFVINGTMMAAGDTPEHALFINDSILNKASKSIEVKVQFTKFFNLDGGGRSLADIKKYASKKRLQKAIKYSIEPGKESKIYESFIQANPLSDGYWLPEDLTISANGLSLYVNVARNDMTDDYIKSKKYSIDVSDDIIQAEIENTLK